MAEILRDDFDAIRATGKVVDRGIIYVPQSRTTGISSATLTVSLPKNAVVDTYDIVVRAKRAGSAPVSTVAQVRSPGSDTSAKAVLDFGALRTVSGLELTNDLVVTMIRPWNGVQFAEASEGALVFTQSTVQLQIMPSEGSGAATLQTVQSIIFDSEIRTERLLIQFSTAVDMADLAEELFVVLPEPPSDLQLQIDGGPPVWDHPGPAEGGAGTQLDDETWNQDGDIIVHLGPALAALTGDPTSAETQAFELTLNSRIPGVLGLRDHQSSLRYATRVAFDGQTAKPVSTTSEGQTDLPLALPDPEAGMTRRIHEVRLTLAGEPPRERILPPVGPDAALLSGALPGPLAELVLDAHRAACVRLDHDSRLAELIAVRLPLATTSDGAEARVVLWQSTEAGQPGEVIDKGTSAAVLLESESEAWTTFAFDAPVEIDPAAPPWAVLLVTRGTVTWSLGAADGSGSNQLRRGPPSGPWKALPAPFQTVTSPLGQLRGRVRISGHSPADAPLAATEMAVVPVGQGAVTPGAALVSIDVAPSAPGTLATLSLPAPGGGTPAVAAAALRITNRVPGDLTLRDVDVVWSQSPTTVNG